jgi:hypothetical protein
MVKNGLRRAMPFDFASNSVSAITLISEEGIEFLIVNTPNLSADYESEAVLILNHISSRVSCPVVLASRQASGEWFLFGDSQCASAFRREVLEHARWSQHSLAGKQSNK